MDGQQKNGNDGAGKCEDGCHSCGGHDGCCGSCGHHGCGGCGGYGSCGHGYHGFRIVRWALLAVIIIASYCIGVKVGEFKAAFGDEFGDYGYGGYGYHRGYMMPDNVYYYRTMPMMYGGQVWGSAQSAAPTTGAPVQAPAKTQAQ